jgi:hypothetical protein
MQIESAIELEWVNPCFSSFWVDEGPLEVDGWVWRQWDTTAQISFVLHPTWRVQGLPHCLIECLSLLTNPDLGVGPSE